MGMFEHIDFSHVEMELQPGDMLLLYTDGINEAENMDGKQFGMENLARIALESSARSPIELIRAIIEDVTQFSEGQEQKDDITLLIMQA